MYKFWDSGNITNKNDNVVRPRKRGAVYHVLLKDKNNKRHDLPRGEIIVRAFGIPRPWTALPLRMGWRLTHIDGNLENDRQENLIWTPKIPAQYKRRIVKLCTGGGVRTFTNIAEAAGVIQMEEGVATTNLQDLEKDINTATHTMEIVHNGLWIAYHSGTKQEDIEAEEWKRISYSKSTEISSMGRIRRLASKTIIHCPTSKPVRTTNDRGFKYRLRMNDGSRVRFSVAQLVADAFLPPPSGEVGLVHINRNVLDDRSTNLQWIPIPAAASSGVVNGKGTQ